MDEYPISEKFGPTIQGEGPLMGRRTLFLRFAGCDYRCTWCDSKHTWDPPIVKEMMSNEEIWAWLARKRKQTGVKTLTLSGGNPGLYNLTDLLRPVFVGNKSLGGAWDLAVETQGSTRQPWFEWVKWLVVSPKPPSSGMTTDYAALKNCISSGWKTTVHLKIVIFTDDDYEFAKKIHLLYPTYPIYLSVGTYTPERGQEGQSVQPIGASRMPERDHNTEILRRTELLIEKVCQDKDWKSDPIILPQLHVLIWGHKRGV